MPAALRALPFSMSRMVKKSYLLHKFFSEADEAPQDGPNFTFIFGEIHCKPPKEAGKDTWVKFDGDKRPTKCKLNPEDYGSLWCFVEEAQEPVDEGASVDEGAVDDNDEKRDGDDDDDDDDDNDDDEDDCVCVPLTLAAHLACAARRGVALAMHVT